MGWINPNKQEEDMADFSLKLVVTGDSVTTTTFQITNCPDDVAVELKGYLEDSKLEKLVKVAPSGVGGADAIDCLLVVNGATLINAKLPVKQIAKIEKKLIHALDLLNMEHSA
jgi:hypothetical protein